MEKQPLILISSSHDLADARRRASDRLTTGFRDLSLKINPFLWEDATENGRRIAPGLPIQRQIDAMLGHQVEATVVMFGERIGAPVQGDIGEGAKEKIVAWLDRGLHHPWPDTVAEGIALAQKGKFPLTGTIYELLVALSLNVNDMPAADSGGNPIPFMPLRVGYVSNGPVTVDTASDKIVFNKNRLFDAPRGFAPDSAQERDWQLRYTEQKLALLNLIKALQKHGHYPQHFVDSDQMADKLADLAIGDLRKRYPAETRKPPVKPDLTKIGVNDRIPFPDRKDLRKRLLRSLKERGGEGRVLVLRGPSGCGKSSLLRKGLLGADEIAHEAKLSIAMQPTDWMARGVGTPLIQFLTELARQFEEHDFAVPRLSNPQGATMADKIANAVSRLQSQLQNSGLTLYLGIDQFEELVDLVGLEAEGAEDNPDTQWHILRFLGAAAKQANILVAVTLESQRRGIADSLGLRDKAGFEVHHENVDFPASGVADYIRVLSSDNGLKLSSDLPDTIQNMVEDFEGDRRERHTSSFLPMLSLWLYRLFETFHDRRTQDAEKDIAGTFKRSGQNDIGKQDLTDRGIDLELAPLIGDMVQDAWEEAGEFTPSRVEVVDSKELNEFLIKIENSDFEFQGKKVLGKEFLHNYLDNKKFDLPKLCADLVPSTMNQIPGVQFTPGIADARALENFFTGLIGIDDSGNMRLLDMPRQSDVASQARLIEAHLKRRLLEPIVATNRVRLVHQAIVLNWPPARAWYDAKQTLLSEARDIKIEAQRAGQTPDFHKLAQNADLVAKAARVLGENRGTWVGGLSAGLDDMQRKSRDFCLGLINAAPNGSLVYISEGEKHQVIAFEAARYDLSQTLDRWLSDDKDLIKQRTIEGDSFLSKAAWGAPKSVAVLLKHGANPFEGDENWHPIAGAIQSSNIKAIDLLMAHYAEKAANTVIGPYGLTMLHIAADAPSTDALAHLLKCCTNVDPADEYKITPLLRAAGTGRHANVEVLLRNGADCLVRDGDQENILHFAARVDSPEIIQLVRNTVTDKQRGELLFGKEEDGVAWSTPINVAGAIGSPKALAELIDWYGDDPIHSGSNNLQPLFSLLKSNQGRRSRPKSSRLSQCCRILLEKGNVPLDVVVAAVPLAHGLPDVLRQLQEYQIDQLDNESDLTPDLHAMVIETVTDPYPKKLNTALRILEKWPQVLDLPIDATTCVWHKIIQQATQGRSEVLLRCLTRDITPTQDRALFRFEAALRICTLTDKKHLPAADGPEISALTRIFPSIDPKSLHPIVRSMVEEPDSEQSKALIAFVLPSGNQGDFKGSSRIRSLLHRMAILGELDLFTAILNDLHEDTPRDFYDRLPSECAPKNRRVDFERAEALTLSQGTH